MSMKVHKPYISNQNSSPKNAGTQPKGGSETKNRPASPTPTPPDDAVLSAGVCLPASPPNVYLYQMASGPLRAPKSLHLPACLLLDGTTPLPLPPPPPPPQSHPPAGAQTPVKPEPVPPVKE